MFPPIRPKPIIPSRMTGMLASFPDDDLPDRPRDPRAGGDVRRARGRRLRRGPAERPAVLDRGPGRIGGPGAPSPPREAPARLASRPCLLRGRARGLAGRPGVERAPGPGGLARPGADPDGER